MRTVKRNLGFTLVELIVSLAILSLLISAFLGIQFSFAKYNQISSLNLKAGLYANNLYEMAKGMHFGELIDLLSKEEILDGELKYVISAERYKKYDQLENSNLIDLIIISEINDKYASYIYCDSINNLLTVQGQGNLNLDLKLEGHYNWINYNDSTGNIAQYQFLTDKQNKILNLHVISESDTDSELYININEQPVANWHIYIHESPFSQVNTFIKLGNQIISTKQLNKSVNLDNLKIYPRKTNKNIGIPIYLNITVFRKDDEMNPICRRQGIIWIDPK